MKKETYDKMKAKLKLPEFSELDKEFEISAIEDGNFPLRDIRRKMIEKVEIYSTLLGEILQPSAESIVNMRECRIFTDDEKKGIYETYKILIALKRRSMEAGLLLTDKDNADVVNEILKKWKELKENLLIIIKKARECWEKETTQKERVEYLG